MGRKRNVRLVGSDERDQTLNQLLVTLDGFSTRQTIVVLAATNREALARVLLGAQRPLVLSDTERRIIAVHEAGHALVAHHLPEADRVNHVTILPRGQSLGVTQFVAEEDRYNYSREKLMVRLAVALGGRAAEELTFGPDQVTTGAENDFQVATSLARKMVTHWGMSEQVGVMFVESRAGAPTAGLSLRSHDGDVLSAPGRTFVADANGRLLLHGGALPARHHRGVPGDTADTAASRSSMVTIIDLEVQRLVREGYRMAKTVLREHNDQVGASALAARATGLSRI